jgi:hypothetical protein
VTVSAAKGLALRVGERYFAHVAQAARNLIAEDGDDPVLAAFLSAPVDDRPETEGERLAVETAKAAFHASGRVVPHADVVAAIERRRFVG